MWDKLRRHLKLKRIKEDYSFYLLPHLVGIFNLISTGSFVKDYKSGKVSISFIISSGRTGTEFLAKFFDQNFKNIKASHEPRLSIRDVGIGYHLKEIKLGMAYRYFLAYRNSLFHQLGKNKCRSYIESNPFLYSLIPMIKKYFYRSKILIVIRDGRSYMRSAYSKAPQAAFPDILFYSDNDQKERLKACDIPGDKYSESWNEMTRFEKVCWYWVTINKKILEDVKGTDYLLVKYEDIFNDKDDYSTIRKIVKYFELTDFQVDSDISKVMKNKINENPKYLLPKNYDEWDNEYKSAFEKICGPLMQELGYF